MLVHYTRTPGKHNRGDIMNTKTLTDAQLHFLAYRRDLNEMEIDAVVREQEYRYWGSENHTPDQHTTAVFVAIMLRDMDYREAETS